MINHKFASLNCDLERLRFEIFLGATAIHLVCEVGVARMHLCRQTPHKGNLDSDSAYDL